MGALLKRIGASIAQITKKCVDVIVANKVKSIVIGSVAAVAIGGTATGIAIANKHDPQTAIIENYIAATCETTGSYDEVIYCKDCDEELERKTITVEAIGHTEAIDPAVAPTCIKTGLTAGKHCSTCGEILVAQQLIPAKGHHVEGDWIVEKEATKTENGVKYTQCTVCGDRVSEEIITSLISTALKYTVNDDNTSCTITGISDWYSGDCVIPDTIEGYIITDIGARAFYDCTNLTSVTIPDGVTTIGDYAFYSCDSLTSVVILDGVTTIGDHAFYSCDSLTSVVIPDSVTSIGSSAFEYCDSLTSVYITDIAAWCNISFSNSYANPLYYADNLCLYLNDELVKDLVIPDGVTTIGDYAFYGCGLKSITIPNSVTSIGESAFYNCTSLESVTIGNGVTSIGGAAFHGCSGLTSVYITDIAAWCNISFGNSYANPLCYANNLYLNSELVTELVIPNGVTAIKSYAFYSCDSIVRIIIPDSVTTIGDYAFYKSSLKSITIPDSVKTIGEYAFYDSFCLTSVTIGNGVTSVGEYAFYNCSSLKSITIPDSVTTIGGYAFSNCSSLTNITIPDSVRTIGASAFYGCGSLGCVSITDIAAWCNISFGDKYANPLIDYDALLLLNGKSTKTLVIPDGVTTIGDYAFRNCDSLTSITIPDSVTTIGDSAFDYCSSLTSVYITDIAAWCNISFGDKYANPLSYADNLYLNGELVTELVIPNGVTTIKSYAFYYCSGLTNITIPDSVTTIGSNAFEYCFRLKSVTIGNSVTTIGDYAFRNCDSLTSITIPDSVTSIGYHAFAGCNNLTRVTIGNGVKNFAGVFVNCDISHIVIGNGVTTVSRSMFSGFDKLYSITGVTIGSGVTTIEADAFNDWTDIYAVNITDIAAWCNISFGDLGANPIRTESNVWVEGKLVTELVIPDGVTSIGDYAFSNFFDLKSITIPDSVKTIGEYAFYDCFCLTSVTIGNGITSVGEHAFYDCDIINSVNITDIAAWCNISFDDEYANPLYYAHTLYLDGELVKELVIPDSVTSIGEWAFDGCTSLTGVYITDIAAWCNISFGNLSSNPLSYAKKLYLNGELVTELVIPDGVTTISDRAFCNCDSLTSITIGDSVTTIGGYAFYDCDKLISVTIPDSVTSIGNSSFSGCYSLTDVYITDLAAWCNISFGNSVANPLYRAHELYLNAELVTELVIPDGVTTIGDYAFYNCDSLKSVTIPDSVTSIGEFAFYNCDSLTSITIPFIGASADATGYKAHFGFIFGYSCRSDWEPFCHYRDDSISSYDPIYYTYNIPSALKTLVISGNITSIRSAAFHNCGLTSMNFKGTVEQLKSISNDGILFYFTTIYCTNGRISKDGTVTYY